FLSAGVTARTRSQLSVLPPRRRTWRVTRHGHRLPRETWPSTVSAPGRLGRRVRATATPEAGDANGERGDGRGTCNGAPALRIPEDPVFGSPARGSRGRVAVRCQRTHLRGVFRLAPGRLRPSSQWGQGTYFKGIPGHQECRTASRGTL